MAAKLIPVVVTTEHKGVFFGYIPSPPGNEVPAEIKLLDARMCVSWTADIRGVTGLAAVGPSKSCRIGLQMKSALINAITAIFECSAKAAEAWEKEPWA